MIAVRTPMPMCAVLQENLFTTSGRGTTSVRDHVDKILALIFTPPMLGEVSMSGKNSAKLAFRHSTLFRLLVSAACSKDKVSEKDVLEALRSILKYAPRRKAAQQ